MAATVRFGGVRQVLHEERVAVFVPDVRYSVFDTVRASPMRQHLRKALASLHWALVVCREYTELPRAEIEKLPTST